jgi:hypothetical protein
MGPGQALQSAAPRARRQDLPTGKTCLAANPRRRAILARIGAQARVLRVAHVVLCGRRMYKHISKLLVSILFTACATQPDAPTTASAQSIDGDACPDSVPSALAPAADQDLSFTLNASGVQIYNCKTTSTGYAWTFIAPDADLFLAHNDQTIVGHHFAGPTWEFEDGSTVVGKKAAAASVDPNSIPWLLLLAVGHNDVDGRMTDITSVQRLSTSGGNAPATGCDPDHVGAEADVPYTATYYFYVTRNDNKSNNVRCGG